MNQKKKPPKTQNNLLSFWQKTVFGIGGSADNLMQNAINNMANPVLNICLGVNPVLVSTAIFIARIWDAFTDPFMGSISDNTRTRLGRRRPYIFLGGLLGAIVFNILWRFPSGLSEMGYFWWFLVWSLVFYTCYTIYIVPFSALTYEVPTNYHDRTRVMMFKSIFCGAASMGMAWMYKITQWSCFKNTLDGMQTVAIWFGVIVIVVTAFPTIFIKEPRNAEIKKQPKVKILLSLKETLQVKEFRLLIAALLAICLGLFMVGPLGTYITIYHVYGGDQKAASVLCGVAGTLYGLSTLLAAPFVSLLSSRFGKKRTLLGGLSLGLIGVGSNYFTYNPVWPYLQLISVLMMAPGLSCLWVLSPSMTADICDLDELSTFTRREGMFSAMYGYTMKVGVSLGVLMTGFLLSASGFNAALGADQPESAILILRICYGAIPSIGIIIGIILLSRYHLSAERVQGIQRQIKERQV
jgi:GPH family glycoside/pentoside/hexuronide:cation symporter